MSNESSLLICHPAAAAGHRCWTSSQDAVYPQEVGYQVPLQLGERSATCRGGELVVVFSTQYYPSVIEVFAGSPVGRNVSRDVGEELPSSPVISTDSALLYSSTVFTRVKTVRIPSPPYSGESVEPTTLQAKVILSDCGPFSFLRLLVYPSVNSRNLDRVVNIIAVKLCPTIVCEQNETASMDIESVDEYLKRRRVKCGTNPAIMRSSKNMPKRLSLSDLDEWKRKIRGLVPSTSSDGGGECSSSFDQRGQTVSRLVLEMKFITVSIEKMQTYMKHYFKSAFDGNCYPENNKVELQFLQSLVTKFNDRCNVLVKRQNELLGLPRKLSFCKRIMARHSSCSIGLSSNLQLPVHCLLEAAWVPRVLSPSEAVHSFIIDEFWFTKDVFLGSSNAAPATPIYNVHNVAIEGDDDSDNFKPNEILSNKSELMSVQNHFIYVDSISASRRNTLKGVCPFSLIEHCFSETWLNHYVGGHQTSLSNVENTTRTSNKWKYPKKSKVLQYQIKLLENITKRPQLDVMDTENYFILYHVVACQGLLRGSEDLWLSGVALLSSLHDNSVFSQKNLNKMNYGSLIYVLTVTAPAVVIGRFAVLDKYRGVSDKNAGARFDRFQSQSTDKINDLMLLLAIQCHVGKNLLCSTLIGIIQACLRLLEVQQANKMFLIFIVKLAHSFLDILRKLLLKFGFVNGTSIDPITMIKLMHRCLKLPASCADSVCYLHSVAKKIEIFCNDHIKTNREIKSDIASKINKANETRRLQVEQVQNEIRKAVMRNEHEDTTVRLAKQRLKDQWREEQKKRAACHRELIAKHKKQEAEKIKLLTEIHRQKFLKKREEAHLDIRMHKQGTLHQSNASDNNECSHERINSAINDSDSELSSRPSSGGRNQTPRSNEVVVKPKLAENEILEVVSDFANQLHGNFNVQFEYGVLGDETLPQETLATTNLENIDVKEKDIDKLATDLGCGCFQGCFLQLQDHASDAIVMILDHSMFLNPLQKLFASYSDFILFFAVKNFVTCGLECLEEGEKRNDETRKEIALSTDTAAPMSHLVTQAVDDEGNDSDIDIDAIVEMTIDEFNKKESFESDVVEDLSQKRSKRISAERASPGFEKGDDDDHENSSRREENTKDDDKEVRDYPHDVERSEQLQQPSGESVDQISQRNIADTSGSSVSNNHLKVVEGESDENGQLKDCTEKRSSMGYDEYDTEEKTLFE